MLWLPAGNAFADVTPWVDIELINGRMFIETEISGISGLALIDTGSQFNAINRGFIEAHDLNFRKRDEVMIGGAFGTDYVTRYREVPVEVFGAELVFEDLVEIDVGPPDRQLTIGAGFLKLLLFQFDYPNQRMRAMSRDVVDLKNLSNVESKQDPAGGAPIVGLNLNDEDDVWVVLDTGSSGGILLDRKVAEKHNWLKHYPAIDDAGSGIISSARLQRFNLPVVTLGDFRIENPIIRVPAKGQEAQFFERSAYGGSRIPRRVRKAEGIMGYDLLKHFVVTIDYAHGYVHVAPPAD